jgi:hypothetical protein
MSREITRKFHVRSALTKGLEQYLDKLIKDMLIYPKMNRLLGIGDATQAVGVFVE